MILHSIKWRLQAWHALMLIVVLAGFGFTAYQLDRVSRFQRIDRELQRRAGVVLSALRNGDREHQLPPGGEEHPQQPREPQFNEGAIAPPRGPRLTARDQSLFEGGGTNSYYYALFHRGGRLLSKSDSAPADLVMPARGSNNFTRVRGTRREIIAITPPGEAVIAGLDVGVELAEMRRLAWFLFAAGAGVLVLGLAGGWWMASRAIRPIADISATAAKISAGDLSQRIATGDAASELGQLAGVLNSTFARLDAAFAQQQQFTSDAAHELRTPVSVILTQVQSTLNKERTGAEYRETLEACQRAAQRMRRLIESLLELARFDAGQEKLKRIPFDLAETTRDCAELIQPLAQERRVKIVTELSAASCSGDPVRIGQVITNLLTNAVNYNRPDGEVRASVTQLNGSVVVTVSDTGAGISAEDLPRVFERFYRAEKSRTNSTGSAGLGLSICKAIVEAHGGTIEAESAPGAGAKFTMRLPAEAKV